MRLHTIVAGASAVAAFGIALAAPACSSDTTASSTGGTAGGTGGQSGDAANQEESGGAAGSSSAGGSGGSSSTCDVSHPDYTVGVRLCKAAAEGGFLLFPHKHRGDVYLINQLGQVVHHWSKSQYEPGQSCYLRENGNLVRAAMLKGVSNIGGGEGGRIEEYDWDDNLVWAFDFASTDHSTHHDFKIMPNGNLLMLAVERKDAAAAAAKGFDTTKLQDGYVAPEFVIEVQRDGDSFKIVWEWHVWDHLLQYQSPSLDDYLVPSETPGRLEVQGGAPAFWNHANSIDYNPSVDQIVISARSHNEMWVIDHSTTTAEAATRAGGKYGKGGDFLYRWGNPQTYGSGTPADRMLFNQHDVQWIEPGLPGAGHFLVFNNGLDRPAGSYSTLDEFESPMAPDGTYPAVATGEAWGPKELAWTYVATPRTAFYGSEISGTQRLPNGNTLACEGTTGRFFQVTSAGEMVWEYVNPVANAGPMSQYELAPIDPKTHPENAVFKTHWYPADFAGFAGRDLAPGSAIEESDTACPVDNVNYSCKQSADCTAGGGEDVTSHFTCASGGICCFKLTQGAPPQ